MSSMPSDGSVHAFANETKCARLGYLVRERADI
jgi:hypothetical protein